ncbi:hypothetical protein [Candidatus Methylacidithermus pantelleriae]|uniref:Uncharacterized protein n=1 Tax=Candidatus Methylacidithermus pantelleriae TaxID=2744239 RepID=A0A8J2BMC3_9BACT|nr:hypothetical protein [Candidatus Methylacidithermus pantelleriae]CAF0689514.1 hypothetical protein MPNT_10247 [Candidatus Methylacidithermus pantelleriae]
MVDCMADIRQGLRAAQTVILPSGGNRVPLAAFASRSAGIVGEIPARARPAGLFGRRPGRSSPIGESFFGLLGNGGQGQSQGKETRHSKKRLRR